MIEFSGEISWALQEKAPLRHILIKPDDIYYEYIKGKLTKIIGDKDKSVYMQFKFCNMDDSKTSKQTAFIWVLYDLMAKIQNGGKKGPGMIKSKDLYLQDIRRYSERIQKDIDDELIQFLKDDYYIFDDETIKLENGLSRVTVYHRLSNFTKSEANIFIDIILQELALMDIPEEFQQKAMSVTRDHSQRINDQKYIRFEKHREMSQSQYKDVTKYCEMCFSSFGAGSGDIHHIIPRGAGGNPEKWKEQPANWLHLHRICHNYYHQQGVETVKTNYPHLEYKINSAYKLGAKNGGENVYKS